MNRVFALLALPLCSLAVVACGDDEQDKFKDRDAFCSEWAIEACTIAIVEECTQGNDRESCRAGQRAYCKTLVPSGKYNKEGGKRCADAVGNALSRAVGEGVNPEQLAVYQRLEGGCSEVVSGTGEAGDTCDENSDCATKDGLQCVLKPGELSGTCQRPNEVNPGGLCDGDADVCPEGTFCDAESERCFELTPEDGSCSLSLPCDDETMCYNPTEMRLVEDVEQATCVARGGNQDECMVDAECLSGICSPAGRCVTSIRVSSDSNFDSCADFHD